MTSREKRHWRSLGKDPAEVEEARLREDMLEITYEVGADGAPVVTGGSAEDVVTLAAAAIDYHLNGRCTGHIVVPRVTFERCQRQTIAEAMKRAR